MYIFKINFNLHLNKSSGRFVLEYSDEFEGTMLNTNKWIAMEKGQSGRKDQG